MVQKGILKTRMAGLGKRRKTAVFPKLVFTIKKGVNFSQEDPNYDIKKLALECTAKRMYPDILNYDKLVEITGSFKGPMGCRSFVADNGYENEFGRNNLGVVSINLPRIAIEANGDFDVFWKILEERASIAKAALMTRIERLSQVQAKEAPILYMHGALGLRLDPEEYVLPYLANGRASISLGYIGLHEVANGMFGDKEHPVDSQVEQDFLVSVVKRLREYTDAWKEETGFGFSLYSTPSESLCDRFCRLDVEKFGVVKGVNDKGYYTNSFHVDVRKKLTPFQKIDFESRYPVFASGGFISYFEAPNMKYNLKGLESVWDYTYDRVPYYGTNTPIDECYSCGFSGEATATEEGYKCPMCGNKDPKSLSVTRRVCGYLGAPDARPFNKGKQIEVICRHKHLSEDHDIM